MSIIISEDLKHNQEELIQQKEVKELYSYSISSSSTFSFWFSSNNCVDEYWASRSNKTSRSDCKKLNNLLNHNQN